MSLARIFLAIVLILNSQLVYAQSLFKSVKESGEDYGARLSEFFYDQGSSGVLVPVRLLGNVQKPGLYHIPTDTSLVTLLTISGGPQKNSDFDNISLTNSAGNSRVIELKDLMKNEKAYTLRTGDIVFVPEKDPIFDQSTINVLTVVTGVLSIILTTMVIDDQL